MGIWPFYREDPDGYWIENSAASSLPRTLKSFDAGVTAWKMFTILIRQRRLYNLNKYLIRIYIWKMIIGVALRTYSSLRLIFFIEASQRCRSNFQAKSLQALETYNPSC